jgi:hypothetical protein
VLGVVDGREGVRRRGFSRQARASFRRAFAAPLGFPVGA